MKRLTLSAEIVALMALMASASEAATNLNSSKSNVYKVTYDTTVVPEAQAMALLAELDKLGPADEATLEEAAGNEFQKVWYSRRSH